MKTCKVGGYDNCVELVNGILRIAVTQDFGPRVIGGFIDGGPNIFAVLPDKPMEKIGTGFKLRGGHRLWHSPEAAPRSYAADNDKVKVTKKKDGLEFDCEPEALTGIKKTITIAKGEKDCFILNHKLTNCGQWDVTLAGWGLSMMAPGGFAVIPQGRDTTRNPFAMDRALTLWPYSKFNDYRLKLEDDYIFLRQDPKAKAPIKIGFYASDGWIAYVNNGTALVKLIEFYDQNEVTYPDNGCNVESYSCDKFCEIETLSPLFQLAPQESCEHVEIWQAIAGLPEIKDGKDFDKYVLPKIKA